jgi:hypothetical protein
VVVRQAKQRDC